MEMVAADQWIPSKTDPIGFLNYFNYYGEKFTTLNQLFEARISIAYIFELIYLI